MNSFKSLNDTLNEFFRAWDSVEDDYQLYSTASVKKNADKGSKEHFEREFYLSSSTNST